MDSQVTERFLRYVRIDTQSDPGSDSVPSTEKQKDLSRLLVDELQAIGLDDVEMDTGGYVYAKLPSTLEAERAGATPVLGLLAHVDTSPDAPGADVTPLVHEDYDGAVITLPGDPDVRLDPAQRPSLRDHVGDDIITSDGTTLLGSDDKAGVAVLMQLAEDLVSKEDMPRPEIRFCFTVDEEIGRGVDALDMERFPVNVAYTLDGSGTDALYAETFNAAEATLTVHGVMVHPGYAKGVMVNAVRIASEMIAMLPPSESPEATDEREGYLHPHRISGGDATSIEVQILIRDFTEDGLARRKRYLEDLARLFRTRYPGARIDLKIEDQYKNMWSYIQEVDPRAVTFAHRAADSVGIPLRDEVIRGGTDGARLSEMGIPTPNVFNGGHDYHSRFEWNTVQSLERSLAFTKALVRYWGENGAEGSSATS